MPLRTRPLLWVLDDLLDDATTEALARAVAPERLEARGVALHQAQTGRTAEVPVEGEPVLRQLAETLTRRIGLENRLGSTFRVRHATAGAFHRLHDDDYVTAGARLLVTALVYLSACEGGVTRFPRAEPSLHVEPRPGRVVVWINATPDGSADRAAQHAIAPVRGGLRTTLTWFVYATHGELARAAERARAEPDGGLVVAFDPGPAFEARATLTCIVDPVTPDITRSRLRSACERRAVGYRETSHHDLDPWEPPLEPGSLLYRPATSWDAQRAERQLWQPGVATLHRGDGGPFTVHVEQWTAFTRHGIPTPRSVRLARSDEPFLRHAVESLGGLPVVVRTDDGEGGVGVMRADSWPSLRSLCEMLVQRRIEARLVTFVPDAMHWRCVVVGDQVVTAYKNPIKNEDFRSEPSADPKDYGLTPSEAMADVAVAAARVAGAELAGVDVLWHPSGRLYVLEANSPCFFAQAEEYGAADVAGAIVDRLLEKAAR